MPFTIITDNYKNTYVILVCTCSCKQKLRKTLIIVYNNYYCEKYRAGVIATTVISEACFNLTAEYTIPDLVSKLLFAYVFLFQKIQLSFFHYNLSVCSVQL